MNARRSLPSRVRPAMKWNVFCVMLATTCVAREPASLAQTEGTKMEAIASDSQMQLVDLSHTIEDGMVTYKGLPPPVIRDHLSRQQSRANYADGTEFHIGRIDMVANTGTYLDAPSHRFADGRDLSQLDLASVADIDAVVVDVAGMSGRAIERSAFDGMRFHGMAVLVHTGWDVHWRTERYFEGHPFLTADAAAFLRDAGVKLVGIDSLNIDDTADKRRPVHTILLGAGIPIVEHLRGLEGLPRSGLRFSAVPVKVKGMGTFPVRAYARVGRNGASNLIRR